MNKQMNLPAIQAIMQEFEKQSEMMEMKQEIMDDTVDDVLGDAEDDAERSEVFQEFLSFPSGPSLLFLGTCTLTALVFLSFPLRCVTLLSQ